MRLALLFFLAAPLSCTWPETRMVPANEYGSTHVTISSAPSYTAGTNYVPTTSPDGSTLFVCGDGGTAPGWAVPPDRTPAC